jgi:transporter family-2 protein
MVWLLGLVAFVSGCLNTVQSGANSVLSKTLGQPIAAALIVSAVNAAVYILVIPFVGLSLPKQDAFAEVPWWAWLGGVLGGLYVLTVIFLAEKLGAAIFTGLTVTAGIITSVLLDHYGLVGFKQHTAGLWRVAGCLLMIGGLTLVSIF